MSAELIAKTRNDVTITRRLLAMPVTGIPVGVWVDRAEQLADALEQAESEKRWLGVQLERAESRPAAADRLRAQSEVAANVIVRTPRWIDNQGDVWTQGDDGLMHTPETRPFPREYVEKKWGPLRPAREVSI